MAGTAIYRKCLQAFWRETENLDVTITAASPDTYSPTPTRYSVLITQDYFWKASQMLTRIFARVNLKKLAEILPMILAEEELTLATGFATSNKNWAALYDKQAVVLSNVTYMAERLPKENWREIIAKTSGRDAPSALEPKWRLGTDGKFYVYPVATFGSAKLELQGLVSPELLVSSNANSDIIPQILSDIWIDMAVSYAKKSTGEVAMFQIYSNMIFQQFGLEQQQVKGADTEKEMP